MPYDQVFDKWKAGKLKSGGSGKRVTSHAQAVAIYMSEKKKAKQGNPEYASSGSKARRLQQAVSGLNK